MIPLLPWWMSISFFFPLFVFPTFFVLPIFAMIFLSHSFQPWACAYHKTDVKSQIMEVLTIIMATEDGRLELQSILEEQKRSVATLLLAERKLVLNGRTAAAAGQ